MKHGCRCVLAMKNCYIYSDVTIEELVYAASTVFFELDASTTATSIMPLLTFAPRRWNTLLRVHSIHHSSHSDGDSCTLLVVFQIALLTTQTTIPQLLPKISISHGCQSYGTRRVQFLKSNLRCQAKPIKHSHQQKHGTENYPVIQGQRDQIKSKNIQTTGLFARYHQTKKRKRKEKEKKEKSAKAPYNNGGRNQIHHIKNMRQFATCSESNTP